MKSGSVTNHTSDLLRRLLHRVALALTLLIAASSVGANCNQTPATTPPSCITDAGVMDGGCPGQELRVCINHCRTVAGVGGRCVLDPCSADGATSVCDQGLSCVPNAADPGYGVCAQDDPRSLLGRTMCDPSQPPVAGNTCVEGSFCRADACPNTPAILRGAFLGNCADPVREGGLCDGDFVNALQTPTSPRMCAPCEPGTTCVIPEFSLTHTGTCERICGTKNDCPCGNDQCFPPTLVISNQPAPPFCAPCASTGSSCLTASGSRDRCCDQALSATCSPTTSNICCFAQGLACTGRGQCCGSEVCVPDTVGGATTCHACNAAPGDCSISPDQCCSGLSCSNRLCCPAGVANCDGNPVNGCEATLASDNNNCGACGVVCSGGRTCQSGVCACARGESFCGGTCVNTQTDTNNCGRCGNVCASGDTCTAGVCRSPMTCGAMNAPCTRGTTGTTGHMIEGSCCAGLFCSSNGRCACTPTGVAVAPSDESTFTANYGCCAGTALAHTTSGIQCVATCPTSGTEPAGCVIDNTTQDCEAPALNCSIQTGGRCAPMGGPVGGFGLCQPVPPDSPVPSGGRCRLRTGTTIVVNICFPMNPCPAPDVSDFCP